MSTIESESSDDDDEELQLNDSEDEIEYDMDEMRCGMCKKDFEQGEMMESVGCDYCWRWFHWECIRDESVKAQLDNSLIDNIDIDFACQFCT